VTQGAIEAGGDWRCNKCGQHWDAARLATVGAYAEWVGDRDRVGRHGAEGDHFAAMYDGAPVERLGGQTVTFATRERCVFKVGQPSPHRSLTLYVRFVRRRGSFAILERWQIAVCPFYPVWAAIVVIRFPPLFGYK